MTSAHVLFFFHSATIVRRFLDTTQSQLTYHGLFNLALIPPNTPCALFRSSHLSVLYKHSPGAHLPTAPSNAIASSSSSSQPIEASSSSIPADIYTTHPEAQFPPPSIPHEDTAIYTLVTDQVFLNEPSVVWERLEDVDGGWSTFVDSEFVRSSPAGGDFAGQTAEEALRAAEAAANEHLGVVDPNECVFYFYFYFMPYLCFFQCFLIFLMFAVFHSRALAQQLQAEEEHLARQEHRAYLQEQRLKQQQQQQQQGQGNGDRHEQERRDKKKKKDGNCVIM